MVVAAPPATATATSNTTVAPAGTTVTVNVYPPPPPEPAPAPAAPVRTVAPAPPPPVVVAPPPDPVLARHQMRQFRRGAAGLMAIGAAGMGVALGLQWGRLAALDKCIKNNPRSGPGGDDYWRCDNEIEMGMVGAYYSAIGMGVFVGGMAGAGTMLGNAAATRDVRLNGGTVRPRTGAKLLGIASIVGATAWMVGANWKLLSLEARCDTPECHMKYRPLRYAANDAGALGIGFGAALIGYSVRYEKQGRALMKLRAAPSTGRNFAGLSLQGKF